MLVRIGWTFKKSCFREVQQIFTTFHHILGALPLENCNNNTHMEVKVIQKHIKMKTFEVELRYIKMYSVKFLPTSNSRSLPCFLSMCVCVCVNYALQNVMLINVGSHEILSCLNNKSQYNGANLKCNYLLFALPPY